MEWREEKILVKGIFEEKRSLDGIILLFRNIDQKTLLNSQIALIERHKNLEIIIETCLSALGKQEQKIIKLSYNEGLTNYNLSEALNISERSVATYKRDATIKFAKMIKIFLGLLD
ncbi:hypothetical protein GMA92_15185 [Turicibacter sanguinis]|uniref:RNA polymerase sigma factor 70 region 4 type 2 domain-containing protein n=1 Tax=Turicibacter sanguinis TaxID=154288 RepID=A0A9X5AQU5_9FIRM|nr:hypothetical protein GAZ90_24490 [Phocaeicola vulgatus]MTK22739.1 hypothetical protein [Turicibacter sanguinis]NAK07256.1 hypothetical protein [Escherichia coli]MTK73902.1 hypothetical protein [Turicibacter sanguinis]MTN46484.1 hypothetical protein [Turicibacter sanguinis]